MLNKSFSCYLLISLLIIFSFSACRDTIDDKPALIDTGWYTANPGAVSFTISRANELAGLAFLVNEEHVNFKGKTITLMANLDLSDYSEGEGWTPIGRYIYSFEGFFEGNDKSISGLFIKRDSIHDGFEYYDGLFGSVDRDAKISNLSVLNANIFSINDSVGILVGSAEFNTIINNCKVTGNVIGYNRVGGLAGDLYGIANNCSAIVNVGTSGPYGGDGGGGLVGHTMGDLNNCYAAGAVNGFKNAGGLVGIMHYGSLNNCYAAVEVKSDSWDVGGLVGEMYDNDIGITNCYATGKVSGEQYVGGLVGSFEKNSKVENNFALNPSLNRVDVFFFHDAFGYVAGNSVPGNALDTNYVLDGMELPKPIGLFLEGDPGHEPKINKTYATSRAVYEVDLGWDFGNDDEHPWKWGGTDYPLPVLYWQKPESYPDLPEHLK